MRARVLAEVELDPVRVKVERDRIGPKVLGEDALELVEADLSIAVEVEKLEGNLNVLAPSAPRPCAQLLERGRTSNSASGFLSKPSNATKSSHETLPCFFWSAMRKRMPYC